MVVPLLLFFVRKPSKAWNVRNIGELERRMARGLRRISMSRSLNRPRRSGPSYVTTRNEESLHVQHQEHDPSVLR